MSSLSNEELVVMYQNGDNAALDILLDNNKGIIYKMAQKYKNLNVKRVEFDDLLQEGNMGMIIAAKKYDFNNEKKAKFITYALYWIGRNIYKCLNGQSDKEIKNNELYWSSSSLNVSIGENGDNELIDFIEGVDYGYENIEDKILLQSLRNELDNTMFEELTLREREVLKYRFSWNGIGMTLEELGEIYNCSIERIRQIECYAIRKLKFSSWSKESGSEYYKELTGHTPYINQKINISFENELSSLDEIINSATQISMV